MSVFGEEEGCLMVVFSLQQGFVHAKPPKGGAEWVPQAQRSIPAPLPSSSSHACCFIFLAGTTNQRSWCQSKPAAAPTARQGKLESVSLCDPQLILKFSGERTKDRRGWRWEGQESFYPRRKATSQSMEDGVLGVPEAAAPPPP